MAEQETAQATEQAIGRPTEHTRIREAYLAMDREARYRPAAPSDGMGGVRLSDVELTNWRILLDEATEYANGFLCEENTCCFWIGVSNYRTNRAFIFGLEALRLLCCGDADDRALKLLQMATSEILRERPTEQSLLGRTVHRTNGEHHATPSAGAD